MKVRLRTLLLMMWLLAMTATAATDRRFTLVIDAGHGGHDAGALGTFSKEKNINLNVALAFGRLVEANCPDVKVIYTRKNDIFVPLHERAHIANRNKADLFVSIHTNALPRGKKSEKKALEKNNIPQSTSAPGMFGESERAYPLTTSTTWLPAPMR